MIIILLFSIIVILIICICNSVLFKKCGFVNNIPNNIPNLYGIPKIIHQTYMGNSTDKLPNIIYKNINYIKRLNPDWYYILWRDDDIINFIKNQYSYNILFYYNKINYGVAKADFFRYLLLYKYGGVYLDIKSAMAKPLNEIIKRDTLYLAYWTPNTVKKNEWGYWPNVINTPDKREYQQWWMIHKPYNIFLYNVIKNVIYNIKTKNGIGRDAVLLLTGPHVYTNSIYPLLNNNNHILFTDYKKLGFIYNNIKSDHE